MATLILRSTDVGAPTLSGTNGTLCAVLDWALVQNGWAIEFTATNQRVYRPGVGNRRRLWVAHDSAVSSSPQLATIRGCESATAADATGLVDPFPTVAQMSSSFTSVLVSTAASTAARAYRLIVGVDFVLVAISTSGNTSVNWDMFFFGDTKGGDPGDVWNTLLWTGNSATIGSTSARAMASCILGYPSSTNRHFWCRTIDGSIKSSRGWFHGTGSSGLAAFCSITSGVLMRGGYANRVERERVVASCTGDSSTTVGVLLQVRRGFLPNLWNPLHSGIGALTSDDTFTDPAYNASALFQIAPASSTTAAIIEMSDTWVVPTA